jgi:hypothetical protein
MLKKRKRRSVTNELISQASASASLDPTSHSTRISTCVLSLIPPSKWLWFSMLKSHLQSKPMDFPKPEKPLNQRFGFGFDRAECCSSFHSAWLCSNKTQIFCDPQLENLLPRVTWQRSLHETLAATADAMRQKAASLGISTKRTRPDRSSPPAVRKAGKGASSAQQQKQQHATAAAAGPVPAQVVGIDDSTLRQGILTSRETGTGLISSDLKFFDASPSLCSMLLGISEENDGSALCGVSLAALINPADLDPMVKGLAHVSNAKFGEFILHSALVFLSFHTQKSKMCSLLRTSRFHGLGFDSISL